MTKKDYVLIAKVFYAYLANPSIEEIKKKAIRAVAKDLSEDFAKENPRFKKDLFLVACGFYDKAV